MINKVIAALAMVFLPVAATGAVIFSEDYDSISETWNCSSGLPSGWTEAANCPASNTYNTVTHYAGEISPGGRTGNSLKMWRREGIWTEYHGYLNKTLTVSEFNNHYKELYIRWYVKISPDWDADLAGAETHKLNRAYIGTSAGDTLNEWYMDIKGTTFKTGKLALYNTGGGGNWYSQSTISSLGINDGEWHSIEWRLKLNSTTGASDGGFQIFVDGSPISICDGMGANCSTNQTNKALGVSTGEYFTSLAPPAIGNLTDGSWTFPTSGWHAIEFDDYVVSTTYIGTDSGGGDSRMSIGAGVMAIGSGTTAISP